MARPDLSAQVTQRYDELLSRAHLDSTVATLSRAQEHPDLRYGHDPVCRVLRPQFASVARYRHVLGLARLVARGIYAVSKRLLSDAKLRRACAIEPGVVRLMRVEERNGGPQLVGRLDGFLSGQGNYQIIEYSGTPGGLVSGQALTQAFSALPIMKTLGRRFALRGLPMASSVPRAYRAAHREWGASGLPAIAVVDNGILDLATNQETRSILALLRMRGFTVHVVRSEQLAFRKGRLLADGHAVDVAYYVDEVVLDPIGEDAIIRALERRAVWLVLGPRAGLWYNKAVFAVLSDPAHSEMFEPAVARALRSHVPWTRVVREGRTTRDGRSIELLPFIAEHRESLVLKPAYGAGGTGVVVGASCDERAWQRTLQTALGSPHIVQERVELGGGDFPYLDGARLSFAHFNAGLDPYIWNGRTARSCLVRLSRTPLLNVATSEGSMVPLFLVEG